jgi:hypothetical protein
MALSDRKERDLGMLDALWQSGMSLSTFQKLAQQHGLPITEEDAHEHWMERGYFKVKGSAVRMVRGGS